MHPLVTVAMVVAGAATIARYSPPQPWEYRPAPHDRIKAHRSTPGTMGLVVTTGVIGPVLIFYVLAMGQLAIAAVLAGYLAVAAVLTEAQFLR